MIMQIGIGGEQEIDSNTKRSCFNKKQKDKQGTETQRHKQHRSCESMEYSKNSEGAFKVSCW